MLTKQEASLGRRSTQNNEDKACLSLQGLDSDQAGSALEWGRSRGALGLNAISPSSHILPMRTYLLHL